MRIVWSLPVAILIFGPTAMAAHSACTSNEPARLEVRMFKYGGVRGEEPARKFALFHTIVVEKIRHFQSKAAMADVDIKYLANMKIVPKPENFDKIDPPPASLKDLQNIWQAYSGYLVLLTGKIDEPERRRYYAFSQIYWGSLRPKELGELVEAKLLISSQGGAKAMDSHSMLILFTLAMDAKRRGCHSSVVLHLLQQALEHAQDLERRNELDIDLATVKSFIENLIKSYVS